MNHPAEPMRHEVSERVAAWHRQSGDIIANLDAPKLPELLDNCMAALVRFDLSAIFAYPDEAEPLFLYDGFREHGTRAALDAYIKGAYLLDPFYTACARRVAPGLYRTRDLAPDDFFHGEYFNSWEVHPCISMESGSLAEELGFMMNLPGGFMAIYSLMRANSNQPFSVADLAALRMVEPVVRSAITHHWRDLKPKPRREAVPAWSTRGEFMELAFEHFGQGILSPREQMVVQLVLRGHSAASIARNLDIAEGTVKNHRKSVYAKLGISSQRELFSQFIQYMLR
jgi:DNA-binding CsgD family transcriptional regulator